MTKFSLCDLAFDLMSCGQFSQAYAHDMIRLDQNRQRILLLEWRDNPKMSAKQFHTRLYQLLDEQRREAPVADMLDLMNQCREAPVAEPVAFVNSQPSLL